MHLSELASTVGGQVHGPDVEISGIALDSRHVQPGDLFVAVPGLSLDGAQFVSEAVDQGAAAVCAVEPSDNLPTLVTSDPRAALPVLAASIYGHPARELTLVGITGSLGKTSTTLMAAAMLGGAGITTGTIGSLGISFRHQDLDASMTTPEAPAIHRWLRGMVAQKIRVAVMEVTSHALSLGRVDGLELDVGAVTNIVPDEHLEFHPTPEHYIRTKAKLFTMLKPGAPLVYNLDDPITRELVTEVRGPLIGVSTRGHPEAAVSARMKGMNVRGMELTLRLAPHLVRANGTHAPGLVRLRLPLLGDQQIENAALAAAVALAAGAQPDQLSVGLANLAPILRRMQVVREAAPAVLDDTAGNPDSIRAAFGTVRHLGITRLRAVYGIRGTRGPAINRANAQALAVEALDWSIDPLVVTASDDVADERNRVTDEERDEVCRVLEAAGARFIFLPALVDAVTRVAEDVAEDELILLLGAQGMDRAAEFLMDRLTPCQPAAAS